MTESPLPDPRIALAKTRNELAIFRTSQALDRTTLAWIRTTLTMNSFGLGIIGFFRTMHQQNQTPKAESLHQNAIRFGIKLTLLGVLSGIAVAISHIGNLRRLERGEQINVARWPISVIITVLLVLISLGGLWLFAL